MKVKLLVPQSCPTLWPPHSCSLLDSSSMEFSRQEYRNGLPFPSPGDLMDPGIEPMSPALQADSLPSKPPGNSQICRDRKQSSGCQGPWEGGWDCRVAVLCRHSFSFARWESSGEWLYNWISLMLLNCMLRNYWDGRIYYAFLTQNFFLKS